MSYDELNGLVSFPEDILLEIFSFLSRDDLKNVRFSCRRFREIIGNSSSLLRAFKIQNTQLRRSVKWIRKSKYSTLQLQPTKLSLQKLTKSMEIMGSKLYRLELRNCKL